MYFTYYFYNCLFINCLQNLQEVYSKFLGSSPSECLCKRWILAWKTVSPKENMNHELFLQRYVSSFQIFVVQKVNLKNLVSRPSSGFTNFFRFICCHDWKKRWFGPKRAFLKWVSIPKQANRPETSETLWIERKQAENNGSQSFSIGGFSQKHTKPKQNYWKSKT